MRAPDIPLFDIGAWRAAGGKERAALAARLDRAMQDSGFFLVSGHGIDDSVKKRIRESSRAFFALPDTVKRAYATGVVDGGGSLLAGRRTRSTGRSPTRRRPT